MRVPDALSLSRTTPRPAPVTLRIVRHAGDAIPDAILADILLLTKMNRTLAPW